MPENVTQNIKDSFDSRIADAKANPVNTQGIVIPSAPVNQFISTFNLSNVSSLKQAGSDFKTEQIKGVQKDPQLYKSALNTPVLINLKFSSVSYTDLNNGYQRITDELIFDTVLCTVSQAKKIVKTEIQGRDGTVKEYIGLDDYHIAINGIIVGSNGQRPMTQILALKKMLDAPISIPVVSSFLNNLGIYNVVIEDYTLPQEAGGWSKQDFTINAISDSPVELFIK
jgi:hypothetical protein